MAEFGIAPEEETTLLWQTIKAGNTSRPLAITKPLPERPAPTHLPGNITPSLVVNWKWPPSANLWRPVTIGSFHWSDLVTLASRRSCCGGSSFAGCLGNLARQAKQTVGEGQILRLLGNSALHLGDRVRAEHYMEQALQIHQATNNRMQEQADSLALAMVVMERYDYVAASSHLQNALRLIQTTGDQLLEARIENSLGFGLAALGQYEAALEHHHASRQISAQIGNPFQESHALHNLCTVSRKLGSLETAVPSHRWDYLMRRVCQKALTAVFASKSRSPYTCQNRKCPHSSLNR